ncbi:MAG TPA: glucoamylase family protein [Burkholderiales bacterium]|nr:glucoamylase family protein [Burkholderiales bacterium]
MKEILKLSGKNLREVSADLWVRLRERVAKNKSAGDEQPLRSELFSSEQMQSHGRTLAGTHILGPGTPDRLLKRLAENEGVLIDTCELLTAAVTADCQITPAGEWLLDNFYLIEEQIRTAKRHLPKGYSRELPRLANGPSAGLPRVYDIALETIAHGDGRVDPESLRRFVASYQSVTPLKLGELWAIPIMLRLALIENLRRVAAHSRAGRIDRNLAGFWADQMIEIADKDPKSLILVIADMARSSPPMSTPFVSEFTRRLQWQSPALALPLTWIEQLLSESGLTIEQLVQSGNQQQAADQVSVSNSIGSLRFLGAMDWRDFVETLSVAEQKLREDPGAVYGKMNFATRDQYRHAVEKIAKHSHLSEADVADRAIQLAHEGAVRRGNNDRTAHVGFYLIDKGLRELERSVEARFSTVEEFARAAGRVPLLLYVGAITLFTLMFGGGLLVQAPLTGGPDWALVLLGFVALLSVSQLAVALVNWLTTLLASPKTLPRMDFSRGIPPESSTLVVVPTMLNSPQSIEDLVEALEVRFLANRDDNLRFGLLTDFEDARAESLPEDKALLQLAAARIEQLNEKYPSVIGDAFFLFHRPRRWNPRDRMWMGYERKRGKLADLNLLLRTGATDRFSLVVGNTGPLANVKYVITLDTDTQLPRDSARKFVGALAHPLNHAHYDEDRQRVCEGYGILQPRMGVNLPSTNRSRYARLQGDEAGIDPYTRAVSDVYQDLFGEGSFIGKGIYDVDAFEQSLKDRFPENRILSHDLLEGCYARAALVSDVLLYEEYPSGYSADVSRRHRWIRGDWQVAGWLLPRVPGPGRSRQKNPLSGLSRWKLFDNLRRSLVPAALTLLLLLGWTDLSTAWSWTLAVIGIILIPSLIASVLEIFRKPVDVLLRQHLDAVIHGIGRSLARGAFSLACLPHEAIFSLDAIARATGRMLFTRKRLLEWYPSSAMDRNGHTSLAASFRSMWAAPIIAISTALVLLLSIPAALGVAGPLLVLWLISPAIAWWISRPLVRREARLTAGQTFFLRKLSRKTWAFFEAFVGPEDHWLPPDNYQEYRGPTVAHRTSPTNMGLSLLANLSAYDFGYIPAGQLIERTTNALRTMQTMERHRGHFYNWYDTLSLKLLHPAYISTVDSGNLAGHLLTLRPGLLSLPDQPIVGERWFDGFRDTLGILMDAVEGVRPASLSEFEKDLESVRDSLPTTLAAAWSLLDRLTTRATEYAGSFDAEPVTDAGWWASALARQCRNALDELTFLAPWTALPAPGHLDDFAGIGHIPTLRELAILEPAVLPAIEGRLEANATAAEREWLGELRRLITEASRRARDRMAAVERLAHQAGEFAASMKYDFLYDKASRLLTIGYNVDQLRRDSSYYDLLASEARLVKFVAIAQGQIPQESWFALGRLLTTTGAGPILLSWSGSMFEYLMPLLVMPTYENTLLDKTYKAAVERQIEYGGQRGVPWGMSESGYNLVDVQLNYQYRAFGVPGLGLKRGLGEDLVISPYASALALMVAPEAACMNLRRLAAAGLEGKFGFYEAIDFTPLRQRRGESSTVVRSYMTHHQGMSLLSLAYLLLDRPMQKRFASDPLLQATLLLLQERVPKATALYSHTVQFSDIRPTSAAAETPIRVFSSPDTPIPQVQLLSNGRYHVMVTNAGGGYSRWKNLAVTRWREDSTCDNFGTFLYLRDVASGEFWSNAHQPTLKPAETYAAIFSEGRAEFRARSLDFDTHTEIVVSPEDDIELRRVHITNHSRNRRTIDVTSYAEVVLAPSAAEALHPAFSNLFVQTEIIEQRRAILCTRRPRSVGESAPWMFHLMAVHGAEIAEISYETDRMQFIGRGNTVATPHAMNGSARLSGSQGSVLDPIVAIRYRTTLEPYESVTIDMVSGIGETRDVALSLVEKYQDRRLADRVMELSWTHAQVVLRQINATEADAQLYGRLASSVIYANSSLRADAAVLIKNRRGQSGLWGYAISGDLPIVLLQIGDPAHIDLVRQLVQAHAYWHLKGLAVDLVIWNEDRAGYRQLLQEQIMGLIAAGVETHVIDRQGGVFVRPAEQISDEDRVLLQTVARAIISGSRGTLAEQINRRGPAEVRVARFVPTRIQRSETVTTTATARTDLLLFNGLGGFTPDGREYVISTAPNQVTPAPWSNVLANPQFGTVISESGLGYTWSENAHEFRLTPWHNDPVSDTSGEAYYIRDEERGHFWSPTPLPSRGATPYVTRHGFGYSVFEHTERGIRTEFWIYVALDAAVKYAVLKVRNESSRPRRLSVTGYVEWVLRDLRPKSAMHVITEIDANSGALLARNPYNTEFPDRTAFFQVDDATRTMSGDRTEFLGRNGTLSNPAAMTRSRLSGKVGAALDPCGAIQVPFELAAGQEREIRFTLGVGQDITDARTLLRSFRGSVAARSTLENVWRYWTQTLGAVQVETPDKSLDVLTNGWLLYQTLACRLWARSGYYQSGGAFGFRDQLQDAMALVHTEPQRLRAQLLLCASRQFLEGDVQHWWHPPVGRGVRTHCSDDYLWLPLATCRYVLTTGDTGVLDESVHFLEGRPVPPEDDSYYDLPGRSGEAASLYQHCVQAILMGLRFGEHGLPLIGSGDWNDGMNLVGIHGKGESVWLGFFLYDVLRRFSAIARLRDDKTFVERCQKEAEQLRKNIEQHAWDGDWYRRAYFDDGKPLGAAGNVECQIDAVAQSWSVLSGAGDPTRARMAMESVDRRLVRREHALIQLLDPPFDKSELDPGYIKGYVPGVRENGGQYTHAAIWTAMAFAALGDSRRAWELTAMINPVNHAQSPEGVATYKVEPYVVAADVYAVAPHTGRGGWSWYTGSAGWMYRLIVESLLGLTRAGEKLCLAPCLPEDWEGFTVRYRFRQTVYHIAVLRIGTGDSEPGVTVDGVEQHDGAIPLIDDHKEHSVQVKLAVIDARAT